MTLNPSEPPLVKDGPAVCHEEEPVTVKDVVTGVISLQSVSKGLPPFVQPVAPPGAWLTIPPKSVAPPISPDPAFEELDVVSAVTASKPEMVYVKSIVLVCPTVAWEKLLLICRLTEVNVSPAGIVKAGQVKIESDKTACDPPVVKVAGLPPPLWVQDTTVAFSVAIENRAPKNKPKSFFVMFVNPP